MDYELSQPPVPPAAGSPEFAHRMRAVGRQLRSAGVETIFLVPGTFVGDDTWGIHHALDRFLPRFADWSRRSLKRLVDWIMRDVTNYPPDYVATLNNGINEPNQSPITVRNFTWSGMNNHIGRIAGAVGLIHALQQARIAPEKRILIWGHSHAGNIMALMTNLLAADRNVLQQLYDSTSLYFRAKDAIWQRTFEKLLENTRPLAKVSLDLVTFGTPIRYGWDSGGYSRLLHFVNHHPFDERRPYLTRPPQSMFDLLRGRDGDYVQQFGIAGSNFIMPFIPRNLKADRRLTKFFTPEQHWFHVFRKVRQGMRVADEGKSLLIAYPREPSRWIEHFMGHGTYTLKRWMLFHAEEVSKQLYLTPEVTSD
ncbi:MAG: hypothetical protein VB835_03215 [Pirellulales bacterium]